MKRDADTPQPYRNDVTGEQREMLEAIREVIFEVSPQTDEVIQYGMLGYPGLANLGAQKHHVALYVMPEVLARHRDRFPGADCGRSCLRFRRSEQIDPSGLRDLLDDVLRARLKARSEEGADDVFEGGKSRVEDAVVGAPELGIGLWQEDPAARGAAHDGVLPDPALAKNVVLTAWALDVGRVTGRFVMVAATGHVVEAW